MLNLYTKFFHENDFEQTLLLTVRVEHIFEDLEYFSKIYFSAWCAPQARNSEGVTYLVRIIVIKVKVNYLHFSK